MLEIHAHTFGLDGSISQDFMASTLPTEPAPLPLTMVVDSESRDVNARQT